MNFVFVSPNFPENYYLFIRSLKNNGVNVLGIGDCPYNQLKPELRSFLTEYYYVSSLDNYDEKYRAVAYFIHKYGRIDFIESNNEYWLEDDAKLRSDFNIKSGPKNEDIAFYKSKRLMKEKYLNAGLKVARFHMVDTLDNCFNFIKEVGYPVVVKPDNGVGAAATYKLKKDEDLLYFYNNYNKNILYIMEEFIPGDLISFDGVCDSKGDIVYPTHHVFPTPILEIVERNSDCFYYTNPNIPKSLFNAGQRVLKAFNVKSRFYHLEFFILNQDKVGLGKKGDLIALEANMRAPGGFTPDMINYANSIDIYQIWANVMSYDQLNYYDCHKHCYCAYYGRRKEKNYTYTHEDILNKYNYNICQIGNMDSALALDLGDYFYIAKFDTIQQMYEFRDFLAIEK